MKHIVCSAIAAVLAMACPVFGQISQQEVVNRLIPHPLPQSPNVTALGKFGDYQVNHFSGLPDISIPIYEIKSGPLTVPITLSYHASGVKPTDIAGWVGMGWGISAGGQISCSVQGKSDSEYYSSHALNPNPTVCSDYYYLKDAVSNSIDTEPDVFMYSYPGGRSGKVMFINTANWVNRNTSSPNTLEPYLIPYAPIALKRVNGSKFEITDEKGVLYRFGQDANGNYVTESTTTYVGGQQFQGTTAFHMTEMIAPNSKDQISFAYQPVGVSHSHDISYTYVVTDQCNSVPGAPQGQGPPPQVPCPVDNPIPQLTNVDSDVNQFGISTITFKTGMVKFFLGEIRKDVPVTAQSPMQYLDHIDVYNLLDGNYVLQKTVRFAYSYFKDYAGSNAALKLDAVSIQDSNGRVIQRYKFGYQTNTFSWTLGSTASLNARDLWGYYNGATQNTDLVTPRQLVVQKISPVGTPETVNIGHAVDRTSNEAKKLEGVLNRIDFPTGGYTTFEYESNKYAEAGTPVLAGGLRVKKITSSDGASAFSLIKTYKYGSAEDGIGFANFNTVRFNYNTEQYYSLVACTTWEPSIIYRMQTFHSGSAYNQDAFDSSPVAYDYVTEYTENVAGQRLGYTRYQYANVQNYVDQVVMSSSKSYNNSVGWQRGQLLGKTVADSLGKVVSSTIINYGLFHTTTDRYVSLGVHEYLPPRTEACQDVNYCINEAGEAVSRIHFKFAKFTQSSGAKLPITQTDYVYDKNDPTKFVKTVTDLTYDINNLQVVKSVATHSNGYEQRVTENFYPFQMAAMNESATSGNAKGVSMMKRKHMISIPLETFSYLQKSDNSNQRIISGQATTFRQNDSDTSFVVADKIYVWESEVDVPRTSYQPVVINAAKNGVTLDPNQKLRASFPSYDNNGNVQFMQKANGMPVSYLYGYNKSLPVAQVMNAQNTFYTTVTSNVPTRKTDNLSPQDNSSNTVTKSFPITVDYTGTVNLKMGVPGGAVGYNVRMTYSGINGSNDIFLGKNNCAVTAIAIPNVGPGNYTLTITLTNIPDGTGSGGPLPGGVGACGTVDYPVYTTVVTPHGLMEFVYEPFEETTVGTIINNPAAAHSGNKYLSGDYTANWTKPNARDYWIDYWFLDTDSKWKYLQKTYTGSSSTNMFLTEGTGIDDVRIYPKDAAMTTYTYVPNTGATSVTDPNGKMLFYEYDAFGRLKLTRDTNLNILKTYDYYYKIQP